MNSTLSNADVARKFNVSRATLTRWVNSAQTGQNNLQIVKVKDKYKILDNAHNLAELDRLHKQGQEYKRSNPIKITKPNPEIYTIYNEEEIIEMLNDLEFKKQINLKYSYKNGGATYWNNRYLSGVSPIQKTTKDLTDSIINDLDYLVSDQKKVNLIDLGPGNGYPVKTIIEDFNNKNLINKYIPIDVSPEILEITKSNIKNWFPDLDIRDYCLDIESSRFGKVFLENKSLTKNIPNIVLYIGNTIANHDDSVRVIKNLADGLTDNDVIIMTYTLDSNATRSTLNYAKNLDADKHHTWLLELFGIDVEKCQTKVEYLAEKKVKIKYLILDKDYRISINLFGEEKVLELKNKELIVIWEHYLVSYIDFVKQIQDSGLEILVSRKSLDLSSGMVACKIVANK